MVRNIFIVCIMCALCMGCTTRYQINIKAVPGQQYDVFVDKGRCGSTSGGGVATVKTEPRSIFKPIFLEIKDNQGKYGSLQMDYNGNFTLLKNVYKTHLEAGSIQKCFVTFLLDSNYLSELTTRRAVQPPRFSAGDTQEINPEKTGTASEDGLRLKVAQNIITTPQEAIPVIKRGQNLAIAGTTLFFSAVAIEYGIMVPWANAIANRFNSSKTHDDSLSAATDALLVLVADVPVGILRTIGPTIACAGASRAYGAYRDGIDHGIPDILVWKPYIAGWVLGAIGGLCSTLGGLAESKDVATVGSYLSLGQEITWGWATVWSLVYASTKKKQASDKGFVIFPTTSHHGSSGFSMILDY
jgi:hypothetical protein